MPDVVSPKRSARPGPFAACGGDLSSRPSSRFRLRIPLPPWSNHITRQRQTGPRGGLDSIVKTKCRNESRTNRARIADSQLSPFVHCEMSCSHDASPPDTVCRRSWRAVGWATIDNRSNPPTSARVKGDVRDSYRARASTRHCRRALCYWPSLVGVSRGCWVALNWVACRTPVPNGVGMLNR